MKVTREVTICIDTGYEQYRITPKEWQGVTTIVTLAPSHKKIATVLSIMRLTGWDLSKSKFVFDAAIEEAQK